MSLAGRPDPAPVEWMTIHEAARLMGVSPATLRRWSDAGDIRTFTTPGGHRRFSRSAIADLLPEEPQDGTPARDPLDAAQRRIVRDVHRASRRVVATASWSEAIQPADRSVFTAVGRAMVDGIVTALTAGDPETRARAMAACRDGATGAGELAGRRGVGLHETVETCLRLRSPLIRELAHAVRRHEVDRVASTRWLEDATCAIDDLLLDVMRGHEAAVGRFGAPAEAGFSTR